MMDEDGLLKRVQDASRIYQAIEDAWWDAIEIPMSEHVAFRSITAWLGGSL